MRRSRPGSWTFAVLLGLAVAAPAGATTDVLRRSFENMPQGLVDAVMSPYTSGVSVVTNLRDVEDTPGVRVAYALPGYAWNVMANFGGGVIRTLTGAMELPIGLVLLFTDRNMEPLFDPVEDNEAVFTWDEYEDIYRVKVGVHYTTGG